MWQEFLKVSNGVGTTTKREYIVKNGVLQDGHTLTATNYRLGGDGTAKAPTITYGSGYVDFSTGASTSGLMGSILIDGEMDFSKYKGIGINVLGGGVGSTSTSTPTALRYSNYAYRVGNELVDVPSICKTIMTGTVSRTTTSYVSYPNYAVAPTDTILSDCKYLFLYMCAINVLRVTDIWLEYEEPSYSPSIPDSQAWGLGSVWTSTKDAKYLPCSISYNMLYDTSTSEFVIQTAGTYAIYVGGGRGSSITTGTWEVYKNGTAVISHTDGYIASNIECVENDRIKIGQTATYGLVGAIVLISE